MREFEQALQDLHSGSISFETFARRSQFYWESQAAKLARRNRLPDGVELADIVQELLLHAWRHIAKHDPTKASFRRYIVFNACEYTSKWLNQQRNSYRRDNNAPSRHPESFSSFDSDGETGGELLSEQLMNVNATAPDLDTPLDVIARIDVAIRKSSAHDPQSAFVLAALKLNRLDPHATIENLMAVAEFETPAQARASIRRAAEKHL